METHSRFFPGESHGQRSLEGYPPWSRKELEVTEHESTEISLGACLSCFQLSLAILQPPPNLCDFMHW